jgi:hypothetical protein
MTGPARHITSYDNFAGKTTLKNRAVGGRIQRLVEPPLKAYTFPFPDKEFTVSARKAHAL